MQSNNRVIKLKNSLYIKNYFKSKHTEGYTTIEVYMRPRFKFPE